MVHIKYNTDINNNSNNILDVTAPFDRQIRACLHQIMDLKTKAVEFNLVNKKISQELSLCEAFDTIEKAFMIKLADYYNTTNIV